MQYNYLRHIPLIPVSSSSTQNGTCTLEKRQWRGTRGGRTASLVREHPPSGNHRASPSWHSLWVSEGKPWFKGSHDFRKGFRLGNLKLKEPSPSSFKNESMFLKQCWDEGVGVSKRTPMSSRWCNQSQLPKGWEVTERLRTEQSVLSSRKARKKIVTRGDSRFQERPLMTEQACPCPRNRERIPKMQSSLQLACWDHSLWDHTDTTLRFWFRNYWLCDTDKRCSLWAPVSFNEPKIMFWIPWAWQER